MEMHDCELVTPAYFDRAPVRIVSAVELHTTRREVFACLEDADAWPRWAPAITEVQWTSPQPFGRGTTRTVSMRGGLVGDEVFIDWEPNQRMAFCFTRANMPVSAFAERYDLFELEPGSVVLQWTMAMTPTGASRVAMPLTRPLLALACRAMLGRFRRLVESG